MKRIYRSSLCAVAAMMALLTAGPAAAREGFGALTKKAAAVTRVSPPAVFLMRTRILVKATDTKPGEGSVAQRLKSQLESELISRDNRLTVEPERPETVIEVNVLQNDASEEWQSREETAVRQVGKDAKGKPILETYKVTVRYKVVTHSFTAAYKVTDRVGGRSLDADTVPFTFKEDFRDGEGAPEIFSLEGNAINHAVERIARRLTPSREIIHVLLPKGSLEALGNLGEAGQWNLYLEALERRPAQAKPIEESYRQYALGTAYEALGYADDDPEVTLRNLEQASLFYGKAVEANPGEKYFTQPYESFLGTMLKGEKKIPPPLERVQTALVGYRRLKDFRDNYDTMLAAKSADDAKSLENAATGQEDRFDNAAVISMVRAGLEQDIVIKAINAAAKPQFDISPKGLIELAENKVDKQIILRIQEIASGKKTTQATKKAAPKKPGTGR